MLVIKKNFKLFILIIFFIFFLIFFFEFNKNQNKKFLENKNIDGLINFPDQINSLQIDDDRINLFNRKYSSWHRSHGNNFNNKFLEVDNLSKDNLNDLDLIFKLNTFEDLQLKNSWEERVAINPIYAENKIFFITSSWELVALSPKTFEILWKRNFKERIAKRGFVYSKNENNNQGYIFINSGINLYKLEADSGKLELEFGNNGFVETGEVEIPGVLYEDSIIVSNTSERKILSINKNSGKVNFSKDIHPDENYFYSNPWGGAALDDEIGYYYIVTGNPKKSTFGKDRPGPNKNANSIIAFDLKKKKIVWTFQDVIHDLWNLDISAPPVLADLKIKNKIIKVIIVTTKSGNTYVFERLTGKSLFDIDYKKTIKSEIPGEKTSPQQPFPKKPKKFSFVEFKEEYLKDELIKNTNFMSKFREKYVYGWFTPPEIGRDLIYLPGGNNWQGSAFNPNTQTLFVPSESIPYKIKVIVKSKEKDNSYQNLKHFSLYQNKCSSCHGTNRNGEYVKSNGLDIKEKFIPSLVGLSIYEGLSKKLTSIDMLKNQHKFMDKFDLSKNEFDNIKDLFGEWDKKLETNKEIFFTSETSLADLNDGSLMTKPPWGTITSINIINGKTNWVKPYGFKDNKEIGTFNAGGVSVTSTNLIIGTGTLDKFVSIINASDGKTLWKYKLDVEGTAAPLIYNFEGKTYIAIFASGGLKPNSERGSFLYIFGVK